MGSAATTTRMKSTYLHNEFSTQFSEHRLDYWMSKMPKARGTSEPLAAQICAASIVELWNVKLNKRIQKLALELRAGHRRASDPCAYNFIARFTGDFDHVNHVRALGGVEWMSIWPSLARVIKNLDGIEAHRSYKFSAQLWIYP